MNHAEHAEYDIAISIAGEAEAMADANAQAEFDLADENNRRGEIVKAYLCLTCCRHDDLKNFIAEDLRQGLARRLVIENESELEGKSFI